MAKVIIEFTVKFKQTLDWPDGELCEFTYDNLLCNLEPSEDDITDDDFDISSVKLNGKEYDF